MVNSNTVLAREVIHETAVGKSDCSYWGKILFNLNFDGVFKTPSFDGGGGYIDP